MEIILQCTEVGVEAPKPDQNSRQISCLESPPGRAALQPKLPASCGDGASRRLSFMRLIGEFIVGGGRGGWGEVSNGFNRICVPPPGWSVMFIRTNLNMYLRVSPRTTERDFFCLLIQSEPSFTARYAFGHLTDTSQSEFVRHSRAAAELRCPAPYWIRERETNDYWRRAHRVTCWRGFSLLTTQRGPDGGSSFTASDCRHTADWQLNSFRAKWSNHHMFHS